MTPLEIMAKSLHATDWNGNTDLIKSDAYEYNAKAALQALDAAGWVVVPEEASEEMVLDAVDAWHERKQGVLDDECRSNYKAMIEAGAYKV